MKIFNLSSKSHKPYIMEIALQTIILGLHHFAQPFLQLFYVVDCEWLKKIDRSM